MAIVEMRKLSLLCMRRDELSLLRTLQRAGCVQLTLSEAGDTHFDKRVLQETDEQIARILWTIQQLSRFDKAKKGMFSQLPDATEADFQDILQNQAALMDTILSVEGLERENGDLKGTQARLRAQMELLLPWRTLDLPAQRVRATRTVLQKLGTVPTRTRATLMSTLSDLLCQVEHLSDERDLSYLWVAYHKSNAEMVEAAMAANGFAVIPMTDAEGTPAQQIDTLRAKLQGLSAHKDALEKRLESLAVGMPRLKLLYDALMLQREREQAATCTEGTKEAVLLTGWVPDFSCERLEKKLREKFSTLEMEFAPATADDEPPVYMKNNRITAPFEAVITNYSLPSYRGLDPTFIMAPFFACFFGMMVSDAGYGLVMAILIPIIVHFMKPKKGMRNLMLVVGIGSVFTFFWGAMFNTWFGAGLVPILINPLEQPIEMMGLCMGLGVVHLFSGLGVAAYMNIKRGKPIDAILDQGLWVLLLVGMAMLVLPPTAVIGQWMAIIGAVGILCTAGRKKPKLLSKITGGFGALYGITSWLSDILSYMRLFGMGLATGVIGMVINMLAMMVLPKGIFGLLAGIGVLIVGHLFNVSINTLGAYVHACRLQYIEFFGKFYEDGGKPFVPLEAKARYVTLVDAETE